MEVGAAGHKDCDCVTASSVCRGAAAGTRHGGRTLQVCEGEEGCRAAHADGPRRRPTPTAHAEPPCLSATVSELLFVSARMGPARSVESSGSERARVRWAGFCCSAVGSVLVRARPPNVVSPAAAGSHPDGQRGGKAAGAVPRRPPGDR